MIPHATLCAAIEAKLHQTKRVNIPANVLCDVATSCAVAYFQTRAGVRFRRKGISDRAIMTRVFISDLKRAFSNAGVLTARTRDGWWYDFILWLVAEGDNTDPGQKVFVFLPGDLHQAVREADWKPLITPTAFRSNG